jgi:hypothetical protein
MEMPAAAFVINHGLNVELSFVSIHRKLCPYDEVETEVQKPVREVLLLV